MGMLTTAFLVTNNNQTQTIHNIQLRYIVTKEDKEDGEMKCENANSQRAPVGTSTGHSSTDNAAQKHNQKHCVTLSGKEQPSTE